MSAKILVADDSLTIQKVIGITLANTGYQLTDTLNESDLMSKVKAENFDLILLDFNLSETTNGYELSKTIKSVRPNAKILILLGTFDSIEEDKFSEYGIADKIVKPFESTKFINKCKSLIEDTNENSAFVSPQFEQKEAEVAPISLEEKKISELDSWVVDAPKNQPKEDVTREFNLDSLKQENSNDPLVDEIQGWGFNNKKEKNDSPAARESYPNIIGNDEISFSFMPEKIVGSEAKSDEILSRFQSSSNFPIDSTPGEFDEDTDPLFEVPEEKRNILNSIDEEVSADSFWAIDDVKPIQTEEMFKFEAPSLVATPNSEITQDLTDTFNEFKESSSPISSNPNISVAPTVVIDEQKIVNELKAHLTPLIEKWIKETCKETVEKVAWDVIPDLAENLIRKEIRELSDSVKH